MFLYRAVTPIEEKNGWDEPSLKAYLAERDAGAPVGGLVVTEFQRAKPAIKFETTRDFNPHRWGRP